MSRITKQETKRMNIQGIANLVFGFVVWVFIFIAWQISKN